MSFEFEWHEENNGELAVKIGKRRIGGVRYAIVAKGDSKPFAAVFLLPGLKMSEGSKDVLGYYENQDAAKERVESAARFWFEGLGL